MDTERRISGMKDTGNKFVIYTHDNGMVTADIVNTETHWIEAIGYAKTEDLAKQQALRLWVQRLTVERPADERPSG